MRLTIIHVLAAHRVNRSPQGVERVHVSPGVGKRHKAVRLADGRRRGGALLVKPADERIPGCLRHTAGHGELIGIRIVLVPDQVLGTARLGFSVGLKLIRTGCPACLRQDQVIAHTALLEGVGDRAVHSRRVARGRIVVDQRLLQRVDQFLALQVRRGQAAIGDGVGIIAVILNDRRRCGPLSVVRLERQILRELLRGRTILGLIARPHLGEGRFTVAVQQLALVGHAHRPAFRHPERLTGRIRHVVDGARVHVAHQLDDGVLLADGQIRAARDDIIRPIPLRSERRGRLAGRSAALVDVERQRRALRGGGGIDELLVNLQARQRPVVIQVDRLIV